MLFTGSSRSPWQPYLAALGVFSCAAVVRLFLIGPLGTRLPFVTFFPAVMIAVLIGGLPAGLLVTALSALLVVYCWIEPVQHFGAAITPDWVALTIFILSSVMISWLGEATRRAQRRLIESEGRVKLLQERQQADSALYDSEAKFRSYVENAPFAVFVIDRDGRFVDFNPATVALFGYPLATLGGMNILELHPPDDHPAVQRDLVNLLELGQIEVESRMVRAGGRRIWVALRAVMLDENHAIGYCQDITEMKTAVQDMGERLALREQLASVAATVPGVINSFLLRPDGSACMPYASPALEEIYGLKPLDVADDAAPLFALIHPDDVQRLRRSIADSAAALTPWQDEYRVNHPRRGMIWVEGHSVPHLEADGSILWHGFLHDVTERKQIEEELRGSEARFRTLVDQAADAFFVHDLDGRILDVNRRACESLGYQREELLRLTVFDLDQGVDVARTQGAWDQISEPGQHRTILGRHRRKDGTSFPVEVRLGSSLQKGARVMLALVRDISEREQNEELIRETARRLELATRAGGFGVWDLDVAADTLLWNDRMFELYGIGRDDFDGSRRAWIDMVHPDDRERVLTAAEAALSGFRDYNTEFRVMRPDGKVKILKADGAVVRDGEGRAQRMIGLNRDITEQRSLEAQLLQAQKMEAVGRLAGGVAHDFNNNLTVILGYAELSKLVQMKSATFHEYLDQIITAAEHSRDITKQLLAFSRNEVIAPRQVDLNQLIGQTEKTLARLIGEDVCLRLTMAEGIWPVLLDPAQLNQIIMNLAVNARDAMPLGGTLQIETKNLVIDGTYCLGNPEARPGEYVQMTVSDTGVGIGREIQEHIFEPFFTTKGIGKGTGLGLATVYGIVSQNDGFIKLYSEPGKGAAFALFFPRLARQGSQGGAPAAAEQSVAAGEGSVLLVEDEMNVRQMARLMLENSGYSVLVADSPLEALQLCRRPELRIDCLLTDVIMPEMNGVELSAAVRELRPDIAVVFMSGYSADMIAQHGVLAPGVIFVQKPFDMDALNEKVREAVRLSRAA